MMPNAKGNYAHLPLPFVLSGIPKLSGGQAPNHQTQQNRQNRQGHGAFLKRRTSELSRFWKDKRDERIKQNLPDIHGGIPVLLEIDPSADIEFLRGLGFEIVSEIEDGFIIVATDDVDFSTLNDKLDKFITAYNSRSDTPARIFGMKDDSDRLQRILSDDLLNIWGNIQDDANYTIDVGIECTGNVQLPKYPQQEKDESDEHFKSKLSNWTLNFNEKYIQWDELKIAREGLLNQFVSDYNGEMSYSVDGESAVSELPDSFTARVHISGKCLRDLAENFGYIFEISLPDDIQQDNIKQGPPQAANGVKLVEPSADSPIVCIVDSGIQEGHKFLQQAIRVNDSICYLKETKETSDYVNHGGHGTRVAGAVLYPKGIPVSGSYQLPCWIRNIRVLNDENFLPDNLYPPFIIQEIVKRFRLNSVEKSKIFNHSIASASPCKIKHMSAWAAEIDNQSYENDVLFIQATGNISEEIIKAYIQAKYDYPKYLMRPLSRISNPAQSLQSLTVGSVNLETIETEDISSLGKKNQPSAFSRSGPGIWDTVKPDVVEYGGTYALNKDRKVLTVTSPPEGCPELIRRSPEGPAYAKDSTGTSFSTPKVAYIASQIEQIFPDSPALLYRALIAQSARWPEWTQRLQPDKYASVLRTIGYGIPDVNKAVANNQYRITLITENEVSIGTRDAHIYQIAIPQELREIGEDFEILIEVTLSYAAKPRRTRRTVKRYLSTWLEWESSNIGEDPEIFKQRILSEGHRIQDDGGFSWVIGSALNRGQAEDFSRRSGTLQKDWTVVKSHQLRNGFCIAVRGHEGWGAAFKAKYALAVSFEAIHQDIAIYEPIRTAVEIEVESTEQEIEISLPDTHQSES